MPFHGSSIQEHPAYAADIITPQQQHQERHGGSSNSNAAVTDEIDDHYDHCKDSPFIDTLVEGAVVIVIALLINVTFWGIIHFTDDPNLLTPTAQVA